VQVGLLTGDIGSNYESRDAALLPLNLWSNSYYTPVSTPHSVVGVGGSQTYVGTDTTVWLYNPGTSAISVNFEYRVAGVLTTAVLSVPGGPAGGYLKQIMPDGSGGHFFTPSGENFYAISATDSNNDFISPTGYGYQNNQNFDWGFDLVPETSLTTQVLVGLGLGRDPNSNVNPGQNGSPVWVTTVGNGETLATIYVDYNGDNLTNSGPVLTDPNGFHYDAILSLKELERARVFDPDGNQTGMLLYSLDPGVKLAAAWGEDPLSASTARPGIDVGTGVTPLPTFDAGKKQRLAGRCRRGRLYQPRRYPALHGQHRQCQPCAGIESAVAGYAVGRRQLCRRYHQDQHWKRLCVPFRCWHNRVPLDEGGAFSAIWPWAETSR
jgi:hypothetical protein